jgi:DUF177 domain-containing protein
LVIRVEDIPSQGKQESFLEDEGPLNERLGGETANSGLHFSGPVQVRVNLSRSGRVILVKSRVEARVKCICARCLDPFALTLTSEIQASLKPKPDPHLATPEEVELSREDLETDFYEGEEVDLSPLVQDQVLLTLPPKVICREDCRGLCQRCGKNLNRETCQCSVAEGDPRLAALKNFRVH